VVKGICLKEGLRKLMALSASSELVEERLRMSMATRASSELVKGIG
jgi:hypothetical protein